MAFPRAKRFGKINAEGPGPSSYNPKSSKDISNPAKEVSSLYKSDRFKDKIGGDQYLSSFNLDTAGTARSSYCLIDDECSFGGGGGEGRLVRRRGRPRSRMDSEERNRSKSTSNLQTESRSPQDGYWQRSFLEIKLEDTREELSTLKVDLHNLRFENEDLRTELAGAEMWKEMYEKEKEECEQLKIVLHDMSKKLDASYKLQIIVSQKSTIIAEAEKQIQLLETHLKLLALKADDDRKRNVGTIDQLRTQKEGVDRELQRSKQKVSSLETEIDNLRKDNEDFEVLIRYFKDKMKTSAEERHVSNDAAMEYAKKYRELQTKYAKLLGHQNSQQKIQHIMNLKDEKLKLQQDLNEKERQLKRAKMIISNLEEELKMVRSNPVRSLQQDLKDVKKNLVKDEPNITIDNNLNHHHQNNLNA